MKSPRLPLVMLSLGLLLGLTSFSARTAGAEAMMPGCDQPTIQALRSCVQHAADMGAIDNQGVTTALLANVAAAQAALDRGQRAVAVDLLHAFINQVEAQAGRHIDAAHADHMVMHAQAVIQALTTVETTAAR